MKIFFEKEHLEEAEHSEFLQSEMVREIREMQHLVGLKMRNKRDTRPSAKKRTTFSAILKARSRFVSAVLDRQCVRSTRDDDSLFMSPKNARPSLQLDFGKMGFGRKNVSGYEEVKSSTLISKIFSLS